MIIQILVEGELMADGTEQVLVEITYLAKIMGYVDLSKMKDGDRVILRQYVKIGDWKLYKKEEYAGKQIEPIIYITPKVSKKGVRVTLQQIAGIYRTFPYQFFKEVPKARVKV